MIDAGAPVRWTRESLARRIEVDVLDPAGSAGSPLPSERALAERYGVSRPSVREVLRGLEQRGRIRIVPGRGAFVRDVSPLDAARAMREAYRADRATPRHLIEARVTLERQTAALAAVRATPEDLRALQAALDGFDRADGLVTRASADIAFHAMLARACANPVLETMFGSISTLVFETILRSLADPDIAGAGIPYHQAIFVAVQRGDPLAAAHAMSEHIALAERTYGPDLDERLDRLVNDVLTRTFGRSVNIEDLVLAALQTFGLTVDGREVATR